MKRIFYSVLFILFFLSGFSQTASEPPQWFLGAKGGLNLLTVNFSPTVSQSYSMRNSYGIIARYMSEKHVGLQLELIYDEKGWEENTIVYQRQLDYISFPFLTHISLGKKNTKFFINIGPQVSYLWQEKTLTSAAVDDDKQYKAIENKFDYGIAGGIGTEFRTKIGVYQLEARYYYGLGNLYGNMAVDYFNQSSNQTISAHFAILFGL
jgi:hypothetical protein